MEPSSPPNGSPFKSYKGDLPFYINQRNINGQTPLYLACTAGHTDVVRTLLDFRPRGAGQHGGQNYAGKKQTYVEVDCYTVLGRTPLHSAVTSGHVEIVELLLKKGADVNLPIKSIQCLMNQRDDVNGFEVGKVMERMHIPRRDNTLLYEACSAEYYNLEVIATLLKHGARDSNGNALLSAMLSMRHDVITTILAHTGVHPDPDYSISETYKGLFKNFLLEHYGSDVFESTLKSGKSFRFTSDQQKIRRDLKKGSDSRRVTVVGVKRATSTQGAFDTPVTIDWHDQNLTDLKLSWLVEAGLRYNPALRAYPLPESKIHIVLATVTRIDISDNSLGSLPIKLFQLPSLQILNASKNKIMHLPSASSMEDGLSSGSSSSSPLSHQNSNRNSEMNSTVIWHAPMLDRLDVSHNWLQSLPPELFFLPALEFLDAQCNDIRILPFEMWMSPKLKTANFSRNYLEDLPSCPFDSPDEAPLVFTDNDEVNTDDWEMLNHQHQHTSPQRHSLQPGAATEKLTSKLSEISRKLGFSYFGARDVLQDMGTLDSNTTFIGNVRLSTATTQTSADSTDSSDDDGSDTGDAIQRRFSVVNFKRHRLGSNCSLQVQDNVEEIESVDEFGSLENLDLSHNKLQKSPMGLPCLAPKLTKLTLSHNLITEFGPMTNYPAGLMDLELSHNKIKHLATPVHRLSFSRKAGMFKMLRSSSNQDASSLEVCFSPASQLIQSRKLSLSPGIRPLRTPGDAQSYSFSGPSASSPPSSQQICNHRRHRVLANLRTLDLSNNRLTELEVILRTTVQSSSEEENVSSDGSSTQEIMVSLYHLANSFCFHKFLQFQNLFYKLLNPILGMFVLI